MFMFKHALFPPPLTRR
ncbi:leader peptide MgtP [Salmonella enterica subsp. enterica serovar Typhimurium var. monophasic 4,5,12:i:-]|nr:leader peptide MgtP [Salmonella enterica subsp. enterica serovar Typhimurium var. monophasic 4,5,12:i:-]